jgi:hypothetical protein
MFVTNPLWKTKQQQKDRRNRPNASLAICETVQDKQMEPHTRGHWEVKIVKPFAKIGDMAHARPTNGMSKKTKLYEEVEQSESISQGKLK